MARALRPLSDEHRELLPDTQKLEESRLNVGADKLANPYATHYYHRDMSSTHNIDIPPGSLSLFGSFRFAGSTSGLLDALWSVISRRIRRHLRAL